MAAVKTKLLLKPHKQILQVLTEQNESNQYDMAKKLNVSYRTILRRTKELEKNRPPLIRLVREEPSEKSGKDRKIYTVTLNGLFFALKNPELWDHIDRIAEYHKDKLLIFKCWQQLTESEKKTVKSLILKGYKLENRTALGYLLNLDSLALFASEKQIKEHVEALFKDLVIPKPLQPIVNRIEILKQARLYKLKAELSRFKGDLESAYLKEIASLSS